MYRVCTCSTQQMHKTPVLWKNVTQPQSVHDSPPPSPYTHTPSPCRKQRYRHARSQVDQYWKLTADKPTSDYPMKLSSPGTIRLAPPPPFSPRQLAASRPQPTESNKRLLFGHKQLYPSSCTQSPNKVLHDTLQNSRTEERTKLRVAMYQIRPSTIRQTDWKRLRPQAPTCSVLCTTTEKRVLAQYNTTDHLLSPNGNGKRKRFFSPCVAKNNNNKQNNNPVVCRVIL